jgi:hypothetical protein
MKTDETLGTDVCNIYVQPLQHMQHPYETLATHTSEILETYACNMHFHHNISLLFRRMEAHRREAQHRHRA